ncbi:hypothetical protein [Mycobacterium marinum]|uniref:hypothetical protein n=1 Tax=Mycobacterium marinum TaxID=1781 RepID=UPI000CD7F2AC|nr:hypothetical protein CCUG20998_03551 [Mycobacterium marinum]RFZ25449.1 hypothetical protein DSM43519_01635 [Mycobacterium marinum]RFZ28336.1 hypothetical protein DSM44344_01381 [Mycobacterium marinum]RFZ33837.1 hypothetical protein NCTC2275_02683 [Mycobacterium marinum]BBC66963.1 hypothetical protein MMRN_38590 [Mycobacterium marinum]
MTLEQIGRRLIKARLAQKRILQEAEAAAIEALAQGRAEAEVARALCVDRMTVRKWAGKH